MLPDFYTEILRTLNVFLAIFEKTFGDFVLTETSSKQLFSGFKINNKSKYF